MFRPGAGYRYCWLAVGAIALMACDRLTTDQVNPDAPPTPPAAIATSPPATSAPPTHSPPTSSPWVQPESPPGTADPYAEAIAKATSALRLSQSAAAPSDWQLVADRWQAAVTWLKTVPNTHPQFAQVAAKMADYQRQQTHAQQQAQRSRSVSTGESPAPRSPAVALRSNEQGTLVPVAPPGRAQASAATILGRETPVSPSSIQVPIKRREGGTPVVEVVFNGRYPFEMIVDTGASGTVITQDMARMLGVVPQHTATVNTATAANVSMPVGMVDSIAVGGRVIRQVPVAIASPALAIGLLGQDFFADYDLVIREAVVEFHARSG
ncbi:retropepsin-like aspartic protease family protein [Trichothermofontia sp.]